MPTRPWWLSALTRLSHKGKFDEEMKMDQKEINDAEWKNPENWSTGFYISKKDSRTFVPKQIPWMGGTINLRTRARMWLLFGFVVGVTLFAIVFLLLTHGE